MSTPALFPVPETLPVPQAPQEATLGTPAHDDADVVEKWTEDDVLRVVWRHFSAQSWAAVPQVTVALRDLDDTTSRLSEWEARRQAYDAVRPGSDPEAYAAAREPLTDRRIDMLLLRSPRKQGIGPLETLALEVKVTRADFLNDVRNPHKQAAWRAAATRHAYVVPAGLVKADEVPEGSGLLAVKNGHAGWGQVEWVKRAPYVHGHAPVIPTRVLVALSHRIGALEGHTRGWHTGPEAAADPQELRAALKAAEKRAERAEKAAEKAEGKAEAWKAAHALAAPAGHPCRWCGRGLKPLNPGAGWFKKWRHIDAADQEPCGLAETAEVERIAREEYDAADQEQRDRQERLAHRSGFVELVEREPWRAFIPYDYRATPGTYTPRGPEPGDVSPDTP